MEKYCRKLIIPILGLISLITIALLAFNFRLQGLLIASSLLLLPAYIVLSLRLLTRIPTFISAQIAFGLALLTFIPVINLIDLRLPYDQIAISCLFIVPFFAIYSLISLRYLLVKEKINLYRSILLFGLAIAIIIITSNWWSVTNETIMSSTILLIYTWVSLVSIFYLAFRRLKSFGKSIIPLAINIVSVVVIWLAMTLLEPAVLYYRYYWRQDGFNVIVQNIETGNFQPDKNNYINIDLPDTYAYLAYDGWVHADKGNDGWSIVFYDSPASGYLYREDGTFPTVCDDISSIMLRINANWFYCNP